MNQRIRIAVWSSLALVGIWVVALTGWFVARNATMTAEKVRAYIESVEFSKLSGVDRAKAIRRLADKINRLTWEERQRLRLGRGADGWFDQMTEDEKGEFIEATLPTGFKQMMSAFEEMPAERRQSMVDDAMKRLREDSARMRAGSTGAPGRSGTNQPGQLSEELQMKVRTIGLQTFYSESSAQTKAELAPLLEEMQRTMEMGGRMRRGPRQ